MRLLALAVTLVAALLGFGGSCRTRVTAVIVSAPQQISPGDTALIAVCSELSGSTPVKVRYTLDWGDDSAETTRDYFPTDDTVRFSHVWRRPGVYHITVVPDEQAFDAQGDRKHIYPVEDDCQVTIDPSGHEPVIDRFVGPEYTAIGMATRFTLVARDPDNDSIALSIAWGDGDTTTAFVASPCTVEMTHEYSRADTFWVKAFCTDVWGIESYADSQQLVVGLAGAVIHWWRASEEEERVTGSPVVIDTGAGERVYYPTNMRFGPYPGDFISHPSYSRATGHIYVASEEGQLYAFDTSLVPAWRYPDTITYVEWGSAAVKGNRLYVPRADDSIFCIVDNGTSVTPLAAFGVAGSIVGAPVIDAAGEVFFGTDSGFLYKLGPGLEFRWRTRLQANGIVYGPALRSDGVLYCTSDSGRLYAINPDGNFTWTTQPGGYVTTMGEGSRPAVGTDGHVYLGAQYGRFYKFNGQTGGILWAQYFGTGEFPTTPIVTANLYVYVQDDDDRLYCVEQGDGDLVWVCDCPASLPRNCGDCTRSGSRPSRTGTVPFGNSGPRRKLPRFPSRYRQLNHFPPNPTILSDGNIVVVGEDAVYLVKGYEDGPLDPLASWPKWQHDLHNSGNVSGGR